jgi:hypothetical protein
VPVRVCALVSRTRAHLVSEFVPRLHHRLEFVPRLVSARLVSAARTAARLGALGPLWAMSDPLSADPVMRTEVNVADVVMSG